jgi:hypothetical protein
MVLTTLELRQIEVKPGNCLTLHHVSWHQFEQILAERFQRTLALCRSEITDFAVPRRNLCRGKK